MIAHIQGRLTEKHPTYVIIDCGGIGYMLNISLNTYSKLGEGESIKLLTHLSIREDAHTLYGFVDEQERIMFRLLISVSGVGANTARMVLSALNPGEISQAILTDNIAVLKSVKGIGAKSAQRIIVDLRDKVGKEEFSSSISFSSGNTAFEEALSALVALGFDKSKVNKTLKKLNETEGEDLLVEELIKRSLRLL